MTGPQRAEQEENAPQSHKPAVGEQERRHHGNAPADVGALRALSWSCALLDLSAAVLYTTHAEALGHEVDSVHVDQPASVLRYLKLATSYI